MKHIIGETVVYGGNGVCNITEIKDISFFHERPKKYYVLEPVFCKQAAVMYVPLDNEVMIAKMQPVISHDEAMGLIESIASVNEAWIDDKNERKDYFNNIISHGTREEILIVIKTIIAHREQLSADGKRLNMQDEKALAEAEKRMNTELAVALNMRPEEIANFVNERMDKLA